MVGTLLTGERWWVEVTDRERWWVEVTDSGAMVGGSY